MLCQQYSADLLADATAVQKSGYLVPGQSNL